jgi:hypothetical protein
MMIAQISGVDVIIGIAVGICLFALFLAVEKWRGKL